MNENGTAVVVRVSRTDDQIWTWIVLGYFFVLCDQLIARISHLKQLLR